MNFRTEFSAVFPALVVASCLAACVGTHERAAWGALAASAPRATPQAPSMPVGQVDSPSRFSTSDAALTTSGPAAYVARALQAHPELHAAYERWRASVHRISRARRLPEPMLGFGYFLHSVETTAGSQWARISLQQTFPWPSKLTAGSDAAAMQARVYERRFEAEALTVSRQVVTAYWDLWQTRRTRVIQRGHLAIVQGLSESIRARLSTGAASLADLQQVDLTAARIEDSISSLDEMERSGEAQLRAAIAAPPAVQVPTDEEAPSVALPAESIEGLVRAANEHPSLTGMELMARAAEYSAQAEAAESLPSFTLGADMMVTNDAVLPEMLAAGVSVPLWQGSYDDSVSASLADAKAQRAEQRALANQAGGQLNAALANVRDAVRRVKLYSGTLVHLAQSAYDSVLGAYIVGSGSLAQTLLAQRDLLELQADLVRAHADYARAWAWLEEVTGRHVPTAPVPATEGTAEP